MDILLLAGLWLPREAWGETAEALRRLGHDPVAVALPGADDGATDATLEDQLDAVLAAVDASERPLVVGHSAACALAWIVADRRPGAVGSVALVGGFPSSDGQAYADLFPMVDGVMPFPGWGPFEGADAADLGEHARRRFAAQAVPVPEGVARGIVRLGDERRFEVPVLVVCPEFTERQARTWVDAGDVPELARARHVSYVDLDTGHWPMLTRPAALAGVLADAAGSI